MSKPTNHIHTFLSISARLTGFAEIELQGTGMVETYYQTVVENTQPDTLQYFFADAADILNSKGSDDDITNAIAKRLIPDSSYNGLAKMIISTWYTGNWGNDVISSQSYIQGLVWDVAEAHPPGAKQPGFGSWANKPIQINNPKV
jgi:hypothetical protein